MAQRLLDRGGLMLKIIDWLFGSKCAYCDRRTRAAKPLDWPGEPRLVLCESCHDKKVRDLKEIERYTAERKRHDEEIERYTAERKHHDELRRRAAERVYGEADL